MMDLSVIFDLSKKEMPNRRNSQAKNGHALRSFASTIHRKRNKVIS